MLEKETKYFETKLPELVKTDSGKFVLIKDDQLYGTYTAMAECHHLPKEFLTFNNMVR